MVILCLQEKDSKKTGQLALQTALMHLTSMRWHQSGRVKHKSSSHMWSSGACLGDAGLNLTSPRPKLIFCVYWIKKLSPSQHHPSTLAHLFNHSILLLPYIDNFSPLKNRYRLSWFTLPSGLPSSPCFKMNLAGCAYCMLWMQTNWTCAPLAPWREGLHILLNGTRITCFHRGTQE